VHQIDGGRTFAVGRFIVTASRVGIPAWPDRWIVDQYHPQRLLSAIIVAVDNPHATRLTLLILATVAEHEREMIAARPKAALQAAKARGVRLSRNGADRLAPANRAETIERARELAPILAELRGAGLSARRMAAELAARGIATPSGGRWHVQSVLRMMERVAR
jgi:hypothetical protein